MIIKFDVDESMLESMRGSFNYIVIDSSSELDEYKKLKTTMSEKDVAELFGMSIYSFRKRYNHLIKTRNTFRNFIKQIDDQLKSQQ